MKYCLDPEILLVWGGRHLNREPTSPCRKGRGQSADLGNTGEGVKNLLGEAWKRRMRWAASEPHPKKLGIWQMTEENNSAERKKSIVKAQIHIQAPW